MKFLQSLSSAYKNLNLKTPQWVNEDIPSIPTQATVSSAAQPSSVLDPVKNLLSQSKDPKVQQVSKETDDILKQIADILKKQAIDAMKKLQTTKLSNIVK